MAHGCPLSPGRRAGLMERVSNNAGAIWRNSMIFATDLGAPEGPVALPDGTWLIVEAAADRGCVTHLSADGRRSVIRQTGRPNGLAIDAAGVIWVAESKFPSL